MTRDLDNVDGNTAKASGWEVQVGDPNKVVCVSKSTYRDGEVAVLKSTKVVDTGSGCIVMVTTEHTLGVAEAVTFVPDVTADMLKRAYA